jgi:hypothetical protein
LKAFAFTLVIVVLEVISADRVILAPFWNSKSEVLNY